MSMSQRADTGDAQRTSGDAVPARLTPRRIAPEWVTLFGAVLVSGILYWIVRPGLIDDSYITLSYARNLATHFRWGMFPEEVANTATAPLNVMVLAAVIRLLAFGIGVQPLVALGVVFMGTNAALALALRRAALVCGLPGWYGGLGAAWVLFNPLVLSTVGLEMALAAMLLALALLAALRGRPMCFGIVAGLLLLTRIDLVIFAVVLFAGTPALRRGWARVLVTTLTVSLPWFTASWFALGSAVPDTLLIKQLQDYWGGVAFGDGLGMYLGVYPGAITLSLLVPVLGLLALPAWALRRFAGYRAARATAPAALLGIGAVCHYGAYTMLGVPPYHWYYAPSIIGLSVALAFLLPTGTAEGRLTLICGVSLVLAQAVPLAQRGVAWAEPPITSNGATSAEYARMGTAMGRIVGKAGVRSPGEIGALAYYCDCVILDDFSDRGYLPAKIEERASQVGPVARWLIKLNYTHFDTSRTPHPTEFVLLREDGFGPDPLWNGDSAYHEPAHFVLRRE